MRPKLLEIAIEESLKTKVPLMIWGPPGIGKSKIISQVVEKIGYTLIDVRLATLDPVDLRGLPVDIGGFLRWLKPSFFPTKAKTVILFDEFSQARPEIQGASLQAVYDYQFGDHKLEDETRVILAGNRTTDRTGASRMISAMKNRVVHITAESHYEDWIEYATSKGVWDSILGYINFAPQHLSTFDPSKDQECFASPRSWEMLSSYKNAPLSILPSIVSGLVGKEIAPAFLAFHRLLNEINFNDIMNNPDTCILPKKQDARYALMAGFSSRVNKDCKLYAIPATKIALRYAQEGCNEMSVASIRSYQTSDKEYQKIALLKVPEFVNWLQANSAFVKSVCTI